MDKANKFSLYDIVVIGLLAALCTLATMIKIHYGNGAMVHLGTAALFTSALLFGGVRAGLAGAIASAFVDIFSGFFVYTVWSFVIKGIAGLLVGSISHSGKSKGKSIVRNIAGCIIGAAWTLVGYLTAWTAVLGTFEAAVANIPSSLISSTMGILVAIPLAASLRTALGRAGVPWIKI